MNKTLKQALPYLKIAGASLIALVLIFNIIWGLKALRDRYIQRGARVGQAAINNAILQQLEFSDQVRLNLRTQDGETISVMVVKIKPGETNNESSEE
jgi:hypothetical protein